MSDARNSQPEPSLIPGLPKAEADRIVHADFDNDGLRDALPEDDSPREALSITQSMIEFLREELRQYQANKLINGRKIPDKDLCVEILSCDSVSNQIDFSAETLRRFLGNSGQKTSSYIIQAVADYLLHTNWITRRDLSVHAKGINIQAAVRLSQFFAVSTSKAKSIGNDLSGRYVQFWKDANREQRLIKAHLLLSYDAQAEVTTAVEEIVRYDVIGRKLTDLLSEASSSLMISTFETIEKQIPRGAQIVGAPIISRGFLTGDHRLLAIFLVEEMSRFPKLYTIDYLGYEMADDPVLLSGARHDKWEPIILTSLGAFPGEKHRAPGQQSCLELLRLNSTKPVKDGQERRK